MDIDDLPPDPDLDEAVELREATGPLTLLGVDEDGNVWEAPISREQAAAALADARRVCEEDEL